MMSAKKASKDDCDCETDTHLYIVLPDTLHTITDDTKLHHHNYSGLYRFQIFIIVIFEINLF